jgi:hypothetical protein
MASVAEDVAHILSTLRALEDRMKALKALLAPPAKKERKPNAWVLFSQRIHALMKENNTPFTSLGESKKFASSLKKEKPYSEWLDAEIMRKRNDWLVDVLLACPVCEENPKEDILSHRDCIVEFATKDGPPIKNPVGAWMCASTTVQGRATEVITVGAEVTPTAPKRRGRRKAPADAETEVSLPGSM